MATQIQLKVLFGKKSDVNRNVIFDVYTHVDNRERARASD